MNERCLQKRSDSEGIFDSAVPSQCEKQRQKNGKQKGTEYDKKAYI